MILGIEEILAHESDHPQIVMGIHQLQTQFELRQHLFVICLALIEVLIHQVQLVLNGRNRFLQHEIAGRTDVHPRRADRLQVAFQCALIAQLIVCLRHQRLIIQFHRAVGTIPPHEHQRIHGQLWIIQTQHALGKQQVHLQIQPFSPPGKAEDRTGTGQRITLIEQKRIDRHHALRTQTEHIDRQQRIAHDDQHHQCKTRYDQQQTHQSDQAQKINEGPAIALFATFGGQRSNILLERMMQTIDPFDLIAVTAGQRTEILRCTAAHRQHTIQADEHRRYQQQETGDHQKLENRACQKDDQQHDHRADVEIADQVTRQQKAVDQCRTDQSADRPAKLIRLSGRLDRHPVIQTGDLLDKAVIYRNSKQYGTRCR